MKNQPGIKKNHENRPETIKNQPETMKNHENRPITMKNQPGTMKNHVKPTWNHENPPRTMKNQPKAMKPTWTHWKPHYLMIFVFLYFWHSFFAFMEHYQQKDPTALIQKRPVTDRGIQLTSFDPKTSRHRHGDPTDLFWSKNVTSPTHSGQKRGGRRSYLVTLKFKVLLTLICPQN